MLNGAVPSQVVSSLAVQLKLFLGKNSQVMLNNVSKTSLAE
jgi:hypothetical protein